MDRRWIVALSLLFSGAAAQAATGVSAHNIDIVEKPVRINGMTTMARLFNGQLPGPLIRAREGEELNATFCNKMTVPTSVHWHGARLPNSQDGVPGITTPEIQPGACLTYKFPVVQSGTYWYHAHSNNQEQQGLYGPLIFDPEKSDPLKTDHEIQVMLSDFTHEDPKWVLLNLKREDDYYALCKGTVQSWDKVIANGSQAVENRLRGAWNRMGPMDKTDVCYSGRGDAFLINGNPAVTRLDDPKKPVLQHESARLRLVNAGASSTFDIRSGCGGPMTIMAKDGMPVEEKDVTSFRMAPAETYDVKIDKHEKESCGIRATSIDGTGEVIGIIGGGSDPVLPPRPEKPNPYVQAHDHQGGGDKNPHAGHDMMNHDMAGHEGMSHHEGMNHEGMDHHGDMAAEAGPLDMSYTGLRAREPAVFNPNKTWKEIEMHLTGQMQGYVWSFDNKISSEAKPIDIRQGDNVRLTLINKSMMDHPIHIHGFFFRVRNDGGDLGPLMNVVIVPVGKKVTVEFNADTPGKWMMHCHIAYHMAAGMAQTLRVTPPSAWEDDLGGLLKPRLRQRSAGHAADHSPAHSPDKPMNHGDNDYFFNGTMGAFSGGGYGEFRYFNTRNIFQLEIKGGAPRQRGEISYERRISPYWGVFAGVEFEREKGWGKAENNLSGLFGARATLPMMIDVEAAVRTDGGWKAKAGSNIDLTERIYFKWGVKVEQRRGEPVRVFDVTEGGYRFNKTLSCGIRRDTEMGMNIGAGCTLAF